MFRSDVDEGITWRARQAALSEFGIAALRSPDLDAILTQGARHVANGLRVPIAKVLEQLPGRDELLVRSCVGLPPDIAVPGHTLVPSGYGSEAGYALIVGEPIVSEVATERRFTVSEIVRKCGATISVNVMIPTPGGTWGTLEADSIEPRVITAEDIDFVATYANLLGAAVERHRNHARLNTLLHELRHRVKNDLQVLGSLLNLETRQADPLARDSLEAVAARLLSLRLLYEQLYSTGDSEEIDLSLYLGRLGEERFRLHGVRPGDPIRLSLSLQPLSVARDDAVALGLIANEFMTNSFKHAFAAGQRGEIGISLGRDERDRVRVVLTDDGVGRKATSGAGGTGVDLIASLASQVRARVDWDGGQGTRLTILLPMLLPAPIGRRT